MAGSMNSGIAAGKVRWSERMGVYLNSKSPSGLFCDEAAATYFIDKSAILRELIPYVSQNTEIMEQSGSNRSKSNKYICITRPRRFGKTIIAAMIASFFGKGVDSSAVFDRLNVAADDLFERHLNQHNVIYISLNELPQNCADYQSYIDRIQRRLHSDLKRAFPNVDASDGDAVWDVLNDIYEQEDERFIFVLDEWDYIFHRSFVTDREKLAYLEFLSNLLKGKAYVELAYMTGILPIAKYSSGSELNMFFEYTLSAKEKYSEYLGFNDQEVDELYQRYLKVTPNPAISRADLKIWYDGYQTVSGGRLYNPHSVVGALSDNQLGSYWTSSGPYEEIRFYIKNNVDQVRDDLALMVSGIAVPAKIQEYAATSMNLTTRDEVFSAMVVYGFLSHENGKVRIPNKELMDHFSSALQKEKSLGYVYQLAKASRKMLLATKAGDTKTMLEILEFAHNTEIPLLSYSNEIELTAVVNLVYLAARDSHFMEREDKAGIGYVDFIFYPINRKEDCIILELKVDYTAKEAIQQIKDRKYALKFQGRLGEAERYTGRILAVGIGYDKKTKEHSCEIEILKPANAGEMNGQ